MEITDFAAALRGMADNVDVLADRHDVKDMAQLRRDAAQHEADRRRDADLIDELRRQVAASGRTLDAIGKLRVMADYQRSAAAQILADALLLISRNGCSNYTRGSCRDYRHRTRGAAATADAWCEECVALDALERAGVRVAEEAS